VICGSRGLLPDASEELLVLRESWGAIILSLSVFLEFQLLAIFIVYLSILLQFWSQRRYSKPDLHSCRCRGWYREIESSFQRLPDEAIEAHAGGGTIWMGAIQLINKLRLLCNIGLGSKPAPLGVLQQNISCTISERDTSTETIVAADFALGGTCCAGCENMIGVPDIIGQAGPKAIAYYSRCRKTFCLSCATLSLNHNVPECLCGSKIGCSLQPLSSLIFQKVRDGAVEDTTGEPLSS
jgi:hypothetical protein